MDKPDFNAEQESLVRQSFRKLDARLGVDDFNTSEQLHKLKKRIDKPALSKWTIWGGVLPNLFSAKFASVFTFVLGFSASILLSEMTKTDTAVYRGAPRVGESEAAKKDSGVEFSFTKIDVKTSTPEIKRTEILDAAVAARLRVEIVPISKDGISLRVYGVQSSDPNHLVLKATIGVPADSSGDFELSFVD